MINELQDLANSLREKVNTACPTDLHEDPNFEYDVKASAVIEYAIKRRKNLLIVGPTGCGKSSHALNIAAKLKENLEIFSCSGETSTDELIGKPWKVEKNGLSVTVPVYGAAIRAYKEGKGLLLEEVDFPNPDVLAALHRIMETHTEYLHVNIGEPETIKRHQGFFVIATANTIGTGEDSFMYNGTKPLNMAFMNRFSLTVPMNFLEPEKEVKVLTAKTGIHQATASVMVQIAEDARKARTQDIDRITCVISTRDLLEWADLIVGMNMEPVPASEYAFLNRISEADRDIVSKLITNRF